MFSDIGTSNDTRKCTKPSVLCSEPLPSHQANLKAKSGEARACLPPGKMIILY